ncbi:MAG: O-antigen ligase family protein [Bacteroidetes bacterium]|nr:O-antigen ligase family protein [Bacteroidota bacterium]
MFGAFSLAFGMMVGTVPTSVPQFILLGNWLLELNFKRKWELLKANKLFWVLASVFLIHAIGLFYTSDLNAGWNDVRTKLPLLFLPVIFFSTPAPSLKEFHLILYAFLLGCIVNISWCYIYSFILHKNDTARSASRFMSHIRLGLYLNMAICSCVYFIFLHRSYLSKVLLAALILFFLFGMYALGLASGIINFFILFFIATIYVIMKQRLKIKLLCIVLLLSAISSMCYYVAGIYHSQVNVNENNYNKLHYRNSNGRLYAQIDSTNGQKENGNYVLINVQYDELRTQWNRRCPTDTFSYEPQFNLRRFDVLLRYLASKALTKDSIGVWALQQEDLSNIKNNINNYLIPQWSYLHKRVYEITYEYEELVNNRDINGHSLTMRPYFWKAAVLIVKSNPVIGIGTGDVQQELNNMYVKSNSPLKKDWYKRPHNQFLTIAVAIGCVGLLIFLFSLIWPMITLKSKFHVLFYPFFILAIISFLLEDTLESQAGLTFFAFFNTLFLSMAWFQKYRPEFIQND